MAGIDNCGKQSCSWKKCKEVGTANLAKSQLEMFLVLLQNYSKNKNKVKDFGLLVQYLGDSLSPKNILRFIGHIRASRNDLLITLSTLRFAHTARCMQSAKLTGFVVDSEKLRVENLQNELEFLKKQDYLNSMLMNTDLSNNIEQTRTQQIQNTIHNYLNNSVNEVSVLNVINASVILQAFKEMYNKLEVEQLNTLKQIENMQTAKTKSKLSVSGRNTKTQASLTGSSQVFAKRKSSSSQKRSTLEVKTAKVGSLTQTGISVGLLKSTNYQGSVTKAQKRSQQTVSEKKSSKTLRRLNKSSLSQEESEINLEIKLDEDNQSTWKSFQSDENYHYEELSSTLKIVEQSCRDILKQYNVITRKLEGTSARMQSKKSDLFNIQMYKNNSNINCETDEQIDLKKVEENTEIELVELQNELEKNREYMYTLQAELKVNVEYYHKIKMDIKNEFKRYCLDNMKIELPIGDEPECIEDIIVLAEIETQEILINSERIIFEKLQVEMKKFRSK